MIDIGHFGIVADHTTHGQTNKLGGSMVPGNLFILYQIIEICC